MRPDAAVWTTKEMEPRAATQVQRALWPSPLALSFASFAVTLFKQNLLDVAQFFGYQPPKTSQNGGVQLEAMKKAVSRFQQPTTKQPGSVKDPSTMEPATEGAAAPTATGQATNKGAVAQRGNTTPPSSAVDDSELGNGVRAKDIFPYDQVRSNMDGAWNAFKRTLREKWRTPREQPPSGCVLISGLVEMQTASSYVIIDAAGWWNPKTRTYDAKSMVLRLRRLQPKEQAPRRA